MTEAGRDSANHCYRHPDRQSFILCQRCGRTICPSCQTEAAVGFHCPECVQEARASAPRSRPQLLRSARRIRTSDGPVITYTIIVVTAVVFLAQQVSGGYVDALLVYRPWLTTLLPWTMLTSLFVHGSFIHVLFNMFSLFIFGRILEPAIGRWRFLVLYLLSGFGGSVAVLLLNPGGGVLGASGAIFGLMGALFAIQRGLGGNGSQLVVLLVLNLAIGFLVPNISWQAHLGGLITGVLIGVIYSRTRRRDKQLTQKLLIGGLAATLVAITVAAVAVLLSSR